MTTSTFDQTKAEVFAGQVIGVLNGAALGQMTSIGHQVGLFDTMASLPPATSRQIADAAGLNERYVREWLGAMVAGRFVEYDPVASTYRLPAEHAAFLTRAAGPGNLASKAQMISALALVEEQVIACFRRGGGVPYTAYGRFMRLVAEETGAVHDAALIDGILPLVPGLPARLEAGIDVADFGCGRGHAVNLMANAYPNSRFTGYDLSEEAIAVARREAEILGVTNARFEVQDVAEAGAPARCDLITAFDAIHDQAQPAQVLANIAAALRPGGTFLMVDVRSSSNLEDNLALPVAVPMYATSTMHCMTVSLAQGGVGLGTMWGEQLARQMLADAGFTRVDVTQAPGDMFNNYFIAGKD